MLTHIGDNRVINLISVEMLEEAAYGGKFCANSRCGTEPDLKHTQYMVVALVQ
jgi:hypothetical protein